MIILPVSDLRKWIGKILNKVEKGETVIIVRYGKPIAKIVLYKEQEDE